MTVNVNRAIGRRLGAARSKVMMGKGVVELTPQTMRGLLYR
jgi:hypothetical protein